MSYPPEWRRVSDPVAAVEIMRTHPFAHLFTAQGGLHATRIPFVPDCEEERPVRLRGHLIRRTMEDGRCRRSHEPPTWSSWSSIVVRAES